MGPWGFPWTQKTETPLNLAAKGGCVYARKRREALARLATRQKEIGRA